MVGSPVMVDHSNPANGFTSVDEVHSVHFVHSSLLPFPYDHRLMLDRKIYRVRDETLRVSGAV